LARAQGLPAAARRRHRGAAEVPVSGLVAALVAALALAAGPRPPAAEPDRAPGWRERNAARARAGLLPRKPPARKPRAFDRRGRKIIRLAAPPPTFLGDPAPVAELGPAGEGPIVELAGGAEAPEPGLRVAAEGVVTELAVSPRRPPISLSAAGVETHAALGPRPGGLALTATGVVAEAVLTLPLR
jgi:hypothetical protein